MDNNFYYEETPIDRKVKFEVTKLKGHALVWWDGIQAERRKKNKEPIRIWDKIVANMKGKFCPKDNKLLLYKHM